MFLSFEGGEGAGKTTLIEKIESTLKKRGFQVLLTREPGGCAFSEKIRDLLLHDFSSFSLDPMAELLLFLAARVQHLKEVIVPALNQNWIVLCDRFHDSTVAYQGAGRGLGEEKVRELCNKACGPVSPEMTFYLDIDPEIGLSRSLARAKLDRMEREALDFHAKVRGSFLKMSKTEPERFILIDATQSKEEVFSLAAKHLFKRLP